MADYIRKCQACGDDLPLKSRSDRKWCSASCQSWANRRSRGAVVPNTRKCPSCGTSLEGMYANAKLCRSGKCQRWNQLHPGQPHPSTAPRVCGTCGVSIDHLMAKAKFCSKRCWNTAMRATGREKYNAKARRWQTSGQAQAYRRAYQKAHAAERQQWARESYRQDPERYRAYSRQWAVENPAACREWERIRRARKLGNPGSVGVSERDWLRMVRRYHGRCAYCGVVPLDTLHMDHVIPLARGGRHAIGNVLPACSHCNHTKHAMLLVAWRRRQAEAARKEQEWSQVVVPSLAHSQ